MELPLFSESAICKTRAHCATCRSLAGDGRAFRRNMARKFSGMEDACPHGVPWGWKKTAADSRQLAPTPANSRIGFPPGDVLKWILGLFGYRQTPQGVTCRSGKVIPACGCKAIQNLMNQWGWAESFCRSDFIIDWLIAKHRACSGGE